MQESSSQGIRKQPLCIGGISYHYDRTIQAKEVAEISGDFNQAISFMQVGFNRVAVSDVSLSEQAVIAAKRSMEAMNVSRKDVDALVIGASDLRCWDTYPEKLKYEIVGGLGLENILSIGVTLGGCTNYSSSIRVAHGLMAAEGFRNVLVIETNKARGTPPKRAFWSASGAPVHLMGDVAMSYVANPEAGQFSVVAMQQISNVVPPELADTSAKTIANMVAYRIVLSRALAQAGIAKSDIDTVFFHNISIGIIDGLIKSLGLPKDALNRDNMWNTGHLWSSDNFISLATYCDNHDVPAGTNFLLMCQGDSDFSATICRKR